MVGAGDGSQVIGTEVEAQGESHQFVIADVIVFVLVEGMEPARVRLEEVLVMGVDGVWADVFFFEGITDEFCCGHDTVGDPVKAGAIEWVEEAGGIADQGESVTGEAVGRVGEVAAQGDVALYVGGVL